MNEFDLKNYLSNNPLMEKEDKMSDSEKEKIDREADAVRDDLDQISKLAKDAGEDAKDIKDMVDEAETPKLTKEGLKNIIKEKITSILSEQEDVEVEDKEDIDVDIEKDVEVDDVSKETDIDVKTSLPGESEDVDAVLGLLTKAREEAERFADDPELGVQIGNTITYFTRKHVAQN
jgi:sugar-specific transcriptional regulator TrmB